MKKFVLKLDLHDGREKQKAFRRVSSLQGIDFIGMDMKEKKLTVIGTVDPVSVVSKLRKHWQADIITVGPAKEPEKKEEPKKEEPKKEEQQPKKDEAAPKEEPKKDEQQKPAEEPKKDEEPKKEEEPKKDEQQQQQPMKEEEPKKLQLLPMPQPFPMQPDPRVLDLARAYRAYNPHMTTYNPPMTVYNPPMPPYYYFQSMEENPNACVIC